MSGQSFLRKSHFIIISLICLSSTGCPVFVDDSYYYVPNDYFTIQEAIDSANPGDTVIIDSGTYSSSASGEFFPIFMKNGVSVEGNNPTDTFIDAQGHNTVFSLIGYNSGTISNLTLTNGSGSRGGGIYIQNSSGTLQNLRVIGNQASNNGSGIYVSDSSGLTLRNIVVTDNSSSSSNDPGQVEITNSDVNFFNNVVAMGDNNGVQLEDGSGGTYENNIFYENGSPGFGAGLADLDTETTATIQYNIAFDNSETDYFLNGMSLSSTEANELLPDDQIANNFSADPLFQDPNTNNFFLQSSSPAVQAGDPSSSFNNPDGNRNTIGAYGGPEGENF